jgi:hypothetical protein
MSTSHSIPFDPAELDQLLRILYGQQAIADDAAIRMIAKINNHVHAHSPLRISSRKLRMDLPLSEVAEIYHRYRRKNDLTSLPCTSLNSTEDPLVNIALTLERIATHLTYPHPQNLGFNTHYRKEMIYCESQYGSYWHLLNDWQQPIPLNARTLTCVVHNLKIVRGSSHSEDLKLHLHVQADKPYCLESPCNSLFSKTLLLSIAHLSPLQLRLPITIEPLESPKHHAFICRLYSQGSPISYKISSSISWPILIRSLKKNLAN